MLKLRHKHTKEIRLCLTYTEVKHIFVQWWLDVLKKVERYESDIKSGKKTFKDFCFYRPIRLTDIFLLALAKMNEKPENTAVVDNSYTPMKDALKAGCLPIAFLSRARYDSSDWPQRLKNIGVEQICCEMSAVKKRLNVS